MPGDRITQQICSITLERTMSAIIRGYTDEGFVIVADGRSTAEGGGINTESAQKIFDISKPGIPLSLALMGADEVTGPDGTVISLHEKLLELCHAVDITGSSNLYFYADTVLSLLRCFLISTNSRLESEDKILLDAYFDGFKDGVPDSVNCRIRVVGDEIQNPESTLQDNLCWRPCVSTAADRLGTAMFLGLGKNPPTHPMKTGKHTPAEVLEIGLAHIKACAEPSNIALDPSCVTIGGRIHGAIVSPNGFFWIDGYPPS